MVFSSIRRQYILSYLVALFLNVKVIKVIKTSLLIPLPSLELELPQLELAEARKFVCKQADNLTLSSADKEKSKIQTKAVVWIIQSFYSSKL